MIEAGGLCRPPPSRPNAPSHRSPMKLKQRVTARGVAPHLPAHGSVRSIPRPTKCRVLRVARVPRRAATMPAICASRLSIGRPARRCRAARPAASRAAFRSNGRTAERALPGPPRASCRTPPRAAVYGDRPRGSPGRKRSRAPSQRSSRSTPPAVASISIAPAPAGRRGRAGRPCAGGERRHPTCARSFTSAVISAPCSVRASSRS